MYRILKKSILAASLLIAPIATWGQISFGGTPALLSNQDNLLRNGYSHCTAIHLQPLHNSDDLQAKNQWAGGPLIVGQVLPVKINFSDKASVYNDDKGGKIYQLLLTAKEAQGLSISFSRFVLPNGGKLYIYNPDTKEVLGAFTQESSASQEHFATAPIVGDKLLIQYEAPTGSDAPELFIDHLGYIFQPMSSRVLPAKLPGLDGSSLCEVNVNCSEGNSVRKQQDAIVHIYCKAGDLYSYCSGTLLNNTAEDFTPYIITAAHCGGLNSPLPDTDYSQWVFTFHYEKPQCNNNYSNPTKQFSITGAHLAAFVPMHKGSDGLLLQLNQAIPAYYGVYYAGWDRTEKITPQHIGLHHPNGDVMKVSTSKEKPIVHQYKDKQSPGAEGAHLRVIYAPTEHGFGITEGGSSGSGLFNEEGLLVGTLTGGNSYCDRNPDGFNSYGRLSFHWNKRKSEGYYMADKLDPKGKGTAEKLAGRYQSVPLQHVSPIHHIEAKGSCGENGEEMATIRWQLPSQLPHGEWLTTIWCNGEEVANIPYKAGENSWQSSPSKRKRGIDTYQIALAYKESPKAEKIYFSQHSVAIRVGEQAGVRELKQERHCGETLLRWKRPINYQFITQVDPSEAHYTTLHNYRYSDIFSYDIPELFIGVRFNGFELKPIVGTHILGVSFVPSRSEKIHHYSLFVRNGENRIRGKKQEILLGDDNDSILWQQAIAPPYKARERLILPLSKPFTIQQDEDLVVGIKVKTETNFDKDVVTVSEHQLPGAAAQGVTSYDSHYWRTFEESFKQTKATPLFAFIISDCIPEGGALEVADLPIGPFPAAMPILKGYKIMKNGVEIKRIDDPSITAVSVKEDGNLEIIPIYEGGASGSSVSESIAVGGTPPPILTPTVCHGSITLHGEHIASLTLYDINGHCIRHLPIAKSGPISIDVSNLNNGAYIAKVTTQDGANYITHLTKE